MDVGGIPMAVPVDKPYAVVELKTGNGQLFSAAVACAWLEGVHLTPRSSDDDTYIKVVKTCYYPPKDKVSSYLQSKKKPLPTWEIYRDVRILAFCKSMGQAKAKMEDATNRTDVSESDSAIPSKRSRKGVSRYSVEMTASTQQHKRSYQQGTANNSSSDSEGEPDSGSALKLQLSQKLLNHNKPTNKKSSRMRSDGTDHGTSSLEAASTSGLWKSQSSCQLNKESSLKSQSGGGSEGSEGQTASPKPGATSEPSNTQIFNSRSITSTSVTGLNESDLSDTEENVSVSQGNFQSFTTRFVTPPQPQGSKNSDLPDRESTPVGQTSAGHGHILAITPTSTAQVPKGGSNDLFVIDDGHGTPSFATSSSRNVNRELSFEGSDIDMSAKKKTPTKGINSGPRFKSPGKRFSPSKLNGMSATHFRTIQAQLGDLRRKVDGLHVLMNRLLRAVMGNVEGPVVEIDGEKVSMLPLDQLQDVKEFEKYLATNEDNMVDMVAYLADHGTSTSLKDSVFAMMKKLLTNKLASQMNFFGTVRKGSSTAPKQKFHGSLGYTLIMGALKRHCNELSRRKLDAKHYYNEAAITGHMQSWLANAPKRLKNKQRTNDNSAEEENEVPMPNTP